MSEYVQTQAASGYPSIALPISDLATTIAFSGGFVSTLTVVYSGITYVQTFTNNGTNVTNISQWVPQP